MAGFGQPEPPGYTSPFAAPAPGTVPYVPAHAAGAPVPWARAVVAIPLMHLAVAVVIAALGGMSGSTAGYVLLGAVAAGLVAVFLAYRDAWSLKTAGNLPGTGIAWWALLAPWAYLWARAARRYGRTNLDWILLAASAALWFLVFAISGPVVSSVATAALTEAGLTTGPVTLVPSCSVPRGIVLSQNPSAGSTAAPGTPVSLTESTGRGVGGRPCV